MNGLNTYTLNYQGTKIKKKEKKNISFRILTAAAGVILLSLILIAIFSLIGSGEDNDNFIRHEIESGESLWSIAAHYYESKNVDLRKVIYDIKKINNIDSSVITPGKELIIPLN